MRMSTSSWFAITLLLCLVGLAVSFLPQPAIQESSQRRRSQKIFAHLDIDDDDDEVNRRAFLNQVSGSLVSLIATPATTLFSNPSVAHAGGLVIFPCTKPLLNVYNLMRAGTTLMEEQDIWSTNPLFLTNREAALSETGIAQVQDACKILEAADISPSVIKYSLAAASMDTAGIVRDELKVGQNRLIPEFTFMDPRAIGIWDMMSYSQTEPAIVAMDEAEAGVNGLGARPPPNEDGTPNETLADQAIRLRQLLSILETQFSGDNILLVFPDGATPALLSAMMAGIPYNKVHQLEFAPGELRLDVTMQSALALYDAKQQLNEEYAATLKNGQEELQRLRSLDVDSIVSKKDQMIETERLAIDEQLRKKQEARRAVEELERQGRLQRARQVEEERQRQRGVVPGGEGTNGGETDGIGIIQPLVIGGALGAYVISSLSGGNDDDDPQATTSNTTATTQSHADGDGMVKTTDVANETQSYVLRKRPLLMNDVPFKEAIQEQQQAPTPTTNGQKKPSLYDSPPPAPIEEDRAKSAEVAMQKYLNEDDGGDDWLRSMAEIIQEDEDDELMIPIEEQPTDKINGGDGGSKQNLEN